MKTETLVTMGIKKDSSKKMSAEINRLAKKEAITEKEARYRILSKNGVF